MLFSEVNYKISIEKDYKMAKLLNIIAILILFGK